MKPKTAADFHAWLAKRKGEQTIIPPPDSKPIYDELKKRPKPKPAIVEVKPVEQKLNAHQRARELDALITPDVLAQWQAWRDEGKPLKWIARNCGIPGVAPNTVGLRLLRHQKATDTPPVNTASPRSLPAVIQPETAVVPDWLPANIQSQVEAFRREMERLGVAVNIGVSVHIVKEIKLP